MHRLHRDWQKRSTRRRAPGNNLGRRLLDQPRVGVLPGDSEEDCRVEDEQLETTEAPMSNPRFWPTVARSFRRIASIRVVCPRTLGLICLEPRAWCPLVVSAVFHYSPVRAAQQHGRTGGSSPVSGTTGTKVALSLVLLGGSADYITVCPCTTEGCRNTALGLLPVVASRRLDLQARLVGRYPKMHLPCSIQRRRRACATAVCRWMWRGAIEKGNVAVES